MVNKFTWKNLQVGGGKEKEPVELTGGGGLGVKLGVAVKWGLNWGGGGGVGGV